jgi:hypothetical protein
VAEPLEGARLKLERARRHLKEVKDELDDFIARGGVTMEFAPDDVPDPARPFRMHVEPPPKSISVTAGDCVHNIRSSLDHLIYALALDNRAGKKPRERTQFPIATKVINYYETGRRQVRPLDPRHRRVIRLLQPYHHPNPRMHWLTILGHLSNRDKHRLLNVALAMIHRWGQRIEEARDGVIVAPVGDIRVVSAHTDMRPLEADPNVTTIIGIGLAFGQPVGKDGRTVLRVALGATDGVVDTLDALITDSEIVLDWFQDGLPVV